MDLTTLTPLTVLSDSVTIVQVEQIKIIRIIHEKASAGISLHGGHLVSFKPTGQHDLIWMSDRAIFDGKAALRGGIPICWPWFGRIASPAHGFARTSEWSLLQHRENDRGVIVELGLASSQQSMDIWPFQFSARLIVEVTDELKVTLEVTNTDDKPWTFSAALHTYLKVSHIRDIMITGVGPEYLDNLQNGARFESDSTVLLSDSVDRVYPKTETQIHLQDPGYSRKLVVENDGHNSAVLWNPWQRGSADLKDMDDDGYLTMMCIESSLHASSLETGKALQPGKTYQLSTKLSIG
ncbi:D-hexose-6-phosphate mutarotase [Vibrio zhanjiangensis]|uniref:Putative glucose-6-phosphate 1-epimerase n=1 Tax=Vibrio zhanjiangensis TaxID=1046128 RepID=A0ABQ6EWW0_9VIBR|nr:D-hexose-6-phosphate mutarotase [Vibrio zhanjiangensis]GLT17653.1 D-hexose-6-phosphate mutarotase [Vibrio zhanjiangensis]